MLSTTIVCNPSGARALEALFAAVAGDARNHLLAHDREGLRLARHRIARIDAAVEGAVLSRGGVAEDHPRSLGTAWLARALAAPIAAVRSDPKG